MQSVLAIIRLRGVYGQVRHSAGRWEYLPATIPFGRRQGDKVGVLIACGQW
ncbi:MAG: hypothetical protein OXG80_04585 [Chloroflexi bacterium]|nr:hypothetical protein [Chloroflexota bacterium]